MMKCLGTLRVLFGVQLYRGVLFEDVVCAQVERSRLCTEMRSWMHFFDGKEGVLLMGKYAELLMTKLRIDEC